MLSRWKRRFKSLDTERLFMIRVVVMKATFASTGIQLRGSSSLSPAVRAVEYPETFGHLLNDEQPEFRW